VFVKFFDLPYCEECGGAQIAHAPERYSLMIEGAIAALFGGDRSRKLERAADRLGSLLFPPARTYALLCALQTLHLGRFKPYESRGNTRALALIEGAGPAGVHLSTFHLFGVTLTHMAERQIEGSIRRNFFRLIPRPEGARSLAFYYMDDKARLKRHLLESDIPCAKGAAVRTAKQAQALFVEIGRPVITKPHCGSRGRHTTIDIRTSEALERGFNIAAQLSPKVIVEAYLKGVVHRVTLVGGKVAAVAKREYPYVVGDGTHSIEELIDIENTHPRRDGIFFKPLERTTRLTSVLASQGYNGNDVPETGMRVYVNDKNSRLNGTVTDDVTSEIHPENRALFERLALVLDDPIIGVDFMMEDVTKPWHEQADAGVLECNSMPFIDVHHKVASGTPINVAKLLWEEVFRATIPR